MVGVTYLVDTNIVSELMRPRPAAVIKTAWQIHEHETAISAITWHELLTGTLHLPHSKRRTAYEKFLHTYLQEQVNILSYTEIAAEWHAEERARLMKMGKTPSFPDGQIAAIAATNNLILVSRNVSDFADFTGLQVENWFTS